MDTKLTPKRPPAITYTIVFVVLAVLTAIEVALSAPSLGLDLGGMTTAVFLLLSAAKASLVAAFFMHLKGDSRLYLFVFIAPVLLLLAFTLMVPSL
jgi:caa(3)-type oxidase subunit IV